MIRYIRGIINGCQQFVHEGMLMAGVLTITIGHASFEESSLNNRDLCNVIAKADIVIFNQYQKASRGFKIHQNLRLSK